MSTPRGFASSLMQGESRGQHATVEPTGQYQNGLSVNALIFAYQVASDTAETGSTSQIINATAHSARVGDIVRFAAGVLDKDEQKVVETGTDWIKVASPFSAAPTNGDTFLIFRPRYAQSDEDGNLQVSVSQGPTQFVLDNVDTEVEEDTSTASNSRPLPVKVFRTDGTSDWADDVETSLANIEASTQATAADIDALESNFGGAADSAASTDTATATFIALFKRSLQHLSTLIAKDFSTEATLQAVDGWLNQLNSVFGLQNDAAASSDTGTFSFMALFKRSLEKLTLIETNTSDAASELQTIDTTLGLLATEATLGGAAVDIASIDSKTPALGQAAAAASVPVVLASDQGALPTQSPVNTDGTCVNASLTGTTAATENAPANTVGFILFADDDNSDPIRFRIGAAASTSAGLRLAPGRDSGFIPCSANLSICATASTGTNAYALQWITR
jgi:hypothetical protein